MRGHADGYARPAIVVFDEQHATLRVAGDEDRTTQGLRRRALSRALLAARHDVSVDLRDLRFADASLMLDLAMLARRLRRCGRCLHVEGAQPDIQRLIGFVGLDRLPGVLVVAPAT